jgi:diadenosine tetraphosphate (Ap4A) HIT family hydrolase
MQFLSGYCILRAEPEVESINSLDRQERLIFLGDMALVGDAIQEVTGAYRINYAIAGNTDPVLHAHIVPRYLSEPEERRKDLPWTYPDRFAAEKQFDAQRDSALIASLRTAIQKRL